MSWYAADHSEWNDVVQKDTGCEVVTEYDGRPLHHSPGKSVLQMESMYQYNTALRHSRSLQSKACANPSMFDSRPTHWVLVQTCYCQVDTVLTHTRAQQSSYWDATLIGTCK